MASRVLTIEIGNSITKICEMDYKSKKPTVYQCFHVVTPPGVLDDGVVENNPELVNAIQTALITKKIKTKQVIFSVSSNKVANRDMDVPWVKDNKIQSVLAANAQDVFPVDLAQYELCYSKGNEFNDETGAKKIKLQAHAIPKYLVQSYRDLADSCGLSIIGIDMMGNSITQIFDGQLTEGVHLVIKIDDASCLLTVFHTNKVVFQRVAMSGVDAAVNKLQNAPDFGGKMPYVEALRRFRTMPLLNARLMTREEMTGLNQGVMPMDPSVSAERAQLTQTLEDMVDGITRIIDFYNSQNSQAPIQDVYLTGIGAEFIGMRELLTNEIGKLCNVVSNYNSLTLDKKIASTSVCAYSACLGAGFAPVLAVSNSKKAKEENTGPSSLDLGKVCVLVFFICIVASAGMAFISVTGYINQMNEYNAAVAKYNNLVGTQEMLLEYQKTEDAYNDFMQMKQYTTTVNEQFMLLISKLEYNMPTDFRLESFSTNGTEVTLNATSDTMEAMANALQTLRYFDEFQTVYMDTFNSEEDSETGETYLKYSIICTYVPYGEEKQGSEAFEDATLQNEVISSIDWNKQQDSANNDNAPKEPADGAGDDSGSN